MNSADLEIEALLTPERAGRLADRSRFVDRVMERVALTERPGARVDLWPAMTPLPWWVQAAADPGVVLACAFAALLIWRADWLEQLGRLDAERWVVLAWPALAQARAALGMDRPAVMLGFLLLAVLGLGWTSIHLFRWSERLVRRSAGASRY